jgi:hypothetical protein
VPARLAGIAALTLILAACGGGPAATGSAATAPPGATPVAPAATGASATGAAIDLSQVDVCAIVPEGTAEALTGEKDFDADGTSSPHSAKCFWGVPRPGVPQYLEVTVERRTTTLQGYGISPNGVACPGITVPGVGAEAVGAVCPGDQTKVWLAAMDKGVVVQVLVNEPKGALTPADLADAVNLVVGSLGN